MLATPKPETNEAIAGVLARAVRMHGAQLFGYVVTSNHLHLLVQIRDSRLSRFMQYLLSNVAKKVGKLINWPGTFWERRFAFEHVLDDGAMLGRLRYILEHGVKEGLVKRVGDWPGLSCFGQLIGERVRACRWFNWTKRWVKGKLRADAGPLLDDKYAEPEPLELAVLPCWRGLSDEQRRKLVWAIVEDIERVGSKTKRRPKPDAVAAIVRQHPHSRPASRKKSPRPHWLCHATFSWARREFRARYASFVADFRAASQRFRSGELLAPFPMLAFRPPIIDAATRIAVPQKASGT